MVKPKYTSGLIFLSKLKYFINKIISLKNDLPCGSMLISLVLQPIFFKYFVD